MNFYEILKTKKLGRGSPDYWTQLFAEHAGGKGEWAVAELTGMLPITFRSNGTALINYHIYGTSEGAGETKNLLEITAGSRTVNGVTFTVDKQAGTITANGTANSGAYFNLPINAPSGDYYYSGCALGGSASTYDVFAWDDTISGRPKKWDGETNVDSDYGGTSQEIKVDSEHSMKLTIRIRSRYTCNNLVFKPMLRAADTTAEFVPYGYKIPMQAKQRTKNIFEIIPSAQIITETGTLKFTTDAETGTITVNGAARSSVASVKQRFTVTSELAGNYYYSGSFNQTGSSSTFDAYMYDITARGFIKKWDGTTQSPHIYGTESQEVKLIEGHNVELTIRARPNTSVNNLVFKPMLRAAGTTPDFEPHYLINHEDIYIGDSKLLSDDYIDYESGKIFKAKRIHEDTVTIDGIVWDILDYDHDEVYKADGTRAKHTVTIQTHDIIDSLQYSARQAAFAFPNGLAAGTYHFTVGEHLWVDGDVNKVLTFTFANAIPSGGQLVFNGAYNQTLVGTTISSFASPTSTTAVETITMTEGNAGTDLGTILRSKTETVNSIDRMLNGSNNWLESAIRQYLNGDKTAGNVWTPQTAFDRPPAWATTTAGFLNGKSNSFISHIGTAKKTTGLNPISDGGGTAVNDEKVFLLSRSEIYMGDEYDGGEDTPYAYYETYSDYQSPSRNADSNRIKYLAGTASVWRLRSPSAFDANAIRGIGLSGEWYSRSAPSSYGIAPTCCIILDDMDDWVKQTFYTEVTADLPAIETFKGENTLDSTETLGQVTIKGKIKPQS